MLFEKESWDLGFKVGSGLRLRQRITDERSGFRVMVKELWFRLRSRGSAAFTVRPGFSSHPLLFSFSLSFSPSFLLFFSLSLFLSFSSLLLFSSLSLLLLFSSSSSLLISSFSALSCLLTACRVKRHH